jgi:Lsr2
MAQKTIVQLIDDLDGTISDSIETITFGLDGATYEIDLSDDHASQLRDELADFVASARRVGGRAKPGAGSSTASTTNTNGSNRSREQTQAIRDWARKNGWEVADRGRIPVNVIEAFETEAGKTSGRKKK